MLKDFDVSKQEILTFQYPQGKQRRNTCDRQAREKTCLPTKGLDLPQSKGRLQKGERQEDKNTVKVK